MPQKQYYGTFIIPCIVELKWKISPVCLFLSFPHLQSPKVSYLNLPVHFSSPPSQCGCHVGEQWAVTSPAGPSEARCSFFSSSAARRACPPPRGHQPSGHTNQNDIVHYDFWQNYTKVFFKQHPLHTLCTVPSQDLLSSAFP